MKSFKLKKILQHAKDFGDATNIGEALLKNNFISPISDKQEFTNDHHLFRFVDDTKDQASTVENVRFLDI